MRHVSKSNFKNVFKAYVKSVGFYFLLLNMYETDYRKTNRQNKSAPFKDD